MSPRAADARRPRPELKEIGGTGLREYGGLVLEDLNTKLQPPDCYEIYDEMLRTDGTVQGVELAISLPIEGLEYWVEAGGEQTSRDTAIADEISTNLFDGMSCTFDQVISECCMAPLQGLNLLEKVWESRNNQSWLRKLAPRHPRTIRRWLRDESGGVQGIVQQLPSGPEVTIPIEYLLRLSWRERAGDPHGRALMRPMYPHWWMKQTFYKIANIGIERFWIPTPQAVLPQGYTDEDKLALKQILESIRAVHAGSIVYPPGYEKASLLEMGSGRLPDLRLLIDHHDALIARAGLAPFIRLGSGETGSWALSDSQVTFFLLALGKIADWICAVFNRYLIPQWVGYNYPGYETFPKLSHGPVAHVVQRAGLLELLGQLASAQIVTADEGLEDQVRDMLDLSPRPETTEGEDDEEETPETIPQEEPEASQGSSRHARRRLRAGLAGRRQVGAHGSPRAESRGHAPSSHRHDRIRLTAADRPRPRNDGHFSESERRTAAAKDGFQKDMSALVKRQHAALKKALAPIIEEFRNADDLKKGTVLRRMQDVEVAYQGQYQNLIAKWLRDFYTAALAKAAEGAGVDAPSTIPNATRTWFAAKAQVIARNHAERLRGEVMLEVLEIARKEMPQGKLFWNVQQRARRRANLDIRDDLLAAGNQLTDLINAALAEAPAEAAE